MNVTLKKGKSLAAGVAEGLEQTVRENGVATVEVWVLEAETWSPRVLALDHIAPLIRDSSTLVWVDLHGAPSQVRTALARIIGGMDELNDIDPRRATEGGEHPPRHPPKAKAFKGSVFARAYWLCTGNLQGNPVRAQEVHVLAGATFAITLRYPWQGWDVNGLPLTDAYLPANEGGPDLDAARGEVLGIRQRLSRSGSREAFGAEVAGAVMDLVVDSVFIVLNSLRERVDELELDVLGGEWLGRSERHRSRSLPARTLGMRRLLRQIRWAFLPSDEMSELLSGPFLELEDRGLRVRFHDLCREADRAVETVRDVTDQVQHTVELSNTMKADRLNDTLYLLTVIATVLLVPTLITGIYGMNFTHLPGKPIVMGFWWSLLGMTALAGGVVFGIRKYFKHLDNRRSHHSGPSD